MNKQTLKLLIKHEKNPQTLFAETLKYKENKQYMAYLFFNVPIFLPIFLSQSMILLISTITIKIKLKDLLCVRYCANNALYRLFHWFLTTNLWNRLLLIIISQFVDEETKNRDTKSFSPNKRTSKAGMWTEWSYLRPEPMALTTALHHLSNCLHFLHPLTFTLSGKSGDDDQENSDQD